MKPIPLRTVNALLFFLLFSVSVRVVAQDKINLSDSVTVTGKINGGAYQNDSLWIAYNPNILTTYSPDHLEGEIRWHVHPDSAGNFQFKLPPADGVGNLILMIQGNPDILGAPVIQLSDAFYPGYLVESGDRVNFSIELEPHGAATLQITGKSSAKYLAVNGIRRALQLYPEEPQFKANLAAGQMLQQMSQAIAIRQRAATAMLDYYKTLLSPAVYQVLQADIQGMQQSILVQALQEFRPTVRKETFTSLMQQYLPAINTGYSPASALYVNYLIRRVILQTIAKRNGTDYELSEIYQTLKNQYNGLLRDKLLASYLLNVSYRYGAIQANRSDAYDACLTDAFQSITQPLFRKAIARQLSKYKQGSQAYNFNLPDAMGNRIQLGEFKGKVVLVDIYGTICSGCRKFATTLKSQVFPVFKDNPDVVFIAISTESNRERWIQDIQEGHNTSSAHEIILYTEGLGVKHPYLQQYEINAVPTLLLIDREGKIANSSAVTLNAGSTGEEVIAMIKAALAKRPGPTGVLSE